MLFKWNENITSMHSNPISVVTNEIATGKFCQRNLHKAICTQSANKGVSMTKGDSGTAVIGLFYLSAEQKYVYFQIGVLSYLKTITHFKRHRDDDGQVRDNVLRQDFGYVSSNLFFYIEWIESIIYTPVSKPVIDKKHSDTKIVHPLIPKILPMNNFKHLNITNPMVRKLIS